MKLGVVRLDAPSVLLHGPEAIDGLPMETLPGLIAQLAALQARAAMRLRTETVPARDDDQLLTIDQVAERLAVTEDWLRRRPELPFIVKLSDGTVRYSSRRLATYITRQSGR
jgi:hypothetical protein